MTWKELEELPLLGPPGRYCCDSRQYWLPNRHATQRAAWMYRFLCRVSAIPAIESRLGRGRLCNLPAIRQVSNYQSLLEHIGVHSDVLALLCWEPSNLVMQAPLGCRTQLDRWPRFCRRAGPLLWGNDR